MNVYCLYFKNGKRYVGTETKSGRRINDHARMSSIRDKGEAKAQVVHLAIRKHGWDSVKWRYLATNCSPKDAYALERTFIHLFKTQDPAWGYNRSEGGETNTGMVVSQKERARRSAQAIRLGTAHLQTASAVAKRVATRKANGNYGPPPAAFFNRTHTRTSGAFRKGNVPHNKGAAKPKPPKKPHSTSQLNTPEAIAKRMATRAKDGTLFKKGYTPAHKGRIALPAGPNGETRYFRAEQLI